MKSPFRNSLLAIFASSVLSACDSQTVYHSYKSIPNMAWGKSDTLFFQLPINDPLAMLQLSVGIRNNNHYPYKSLYLFISHNLEDSTKWHTDTLQLALSDKEGKWTGTGCGNLYQSTQSMKSTLVRHSGTYTIKVVHGMKDEVLKGISDVGIKID